MEIQIILPEGASVESVGQLKQFIQQGSIAGLDSVTIERAVHLPGQMGAGDIQRQIEVMF